MGEKLKKYTVPFRMSCYYYVEVEAADPEDAENIAYNYLPDDIMKWSEFETEPMSSMIKEAS